MNKKIFSLLLLLILLVSATVTYAVFNQTTAENNHFPASGGTVNENTLINEINSAFLDENQGIEIGEMI
jgi:predicted ribosomally synthesized peptide with SipW-like signal peptide